MLGNKKRLKLSCTLDMRRPWSDILHLVRENAGDKWQRWLQAATQPTLINQYQREYYASPDGAVRATLDFNHRFFNQQYRLRPNLQQRLFPPDSVVIEVKSSPGYGPRLQSGMAFFPLPRSRNSKYINGVAAALFG